MPLRSGSPTEKIARFSRARARGAAPGGWATGFRPAREAEDRPSTPGRPPSPRAETSRTGAPHPETGPAGDRPQRPGLASRPDRRGKAGTGQRGAPHGQPDRRRPLVPDCLASTPRACGAAGRVALASCGAGLCWPLAALHGLWRTPDRRRRLARLARLARRGIGLGVPGSYSIVRLQKSRRL